MEQATSSKLGLWLRYGVLFLSFRFSEGFGGNNTILFLMSDIRHVLYMPMYYLCQIKKVLAEIIQ